MSGMQVWRYRNDERYAADVRELILDRPRGDITEVVTSAGEHVRIEPGVAWLVVASR